ncbi:MAG: hypothetical protein CMJ28_00765 [Phycisphaerae bacterium]|nr:hypothetical protein [Phycisphaerae bacterium]
MVPRHLDLERDRGLRIDWSDGRSSYIPVDLLRRMSPSAETKKLREEMEANPLAVLPTSGNGPLRADDAELVGNYAIRIVFSDGHDTGIYTWDYLLHLAEPTAQDTP